MMKKAGVVIGGLSLLVASASAEKQYTSQSLLSHYVPNIPFEQLHLFEMQESHNITNEFVVSKQEGTFCVHLINRRVMQDNNEPLVIQYVNSSCGGRPDDVFINGTQIPSLNDFHDFFEARNEKIDVLKKSYGTAHVIAYLQELQEETITNIITRSRFNKAFSSLEKQLSDELEEQKIVLYE